MAVEAPMGGSVAPAEFVTPVTGLSGAEVRERVARGAVNGGGEETSRTVGQILRANVLTRFNAILGTMLVIILIVGPIQDALFGLVLVGNALIGIVQELRAKRTLDRLAVLNAPRARAVRDGTVVDLAVGDVVLDDLLELRAGDQVPADGVVRTTDGLEVDESLLTGESEPVDKQPGAEVLSGSIVVAGRARVQATRVGPDSYARRLAREAKRFTLVRSELTAGLNLILRYVTWAIFPTAALLFWSQLRHDDGWREAVSGAVAGVVGMVPEGLVLLTSVAFGVAAVTLARRHVLVQELPAVEGLARVDVVCLDKTGTLTEGDVGFGALELLGGGRDEVTAALGALGDDEQRNATLAAVAEEFPPSGWRRTGAVPFSSARKWSAARFDGHGTWVLGAPEMVLPDAGPADPVRRRADELAADGSRVLLLARTASELAGDVLPGGLEPCALVLLAEKVRPDAPDTLRYFAEQGVSLRVISGDNPRTVAAVARRVGLDGAAEGYDARTLPEDRDALADVMERERVFGRVDPHQKRAIVAALQSRGHVVAMTGDGVNDALALKDADIGVAMGSGAPATRAVAQLVLLDGRFSTMPGVVGEGRRVIANIERVANLFVTKTVWVTLLALTIAVLGWPFPFLPRHLTVISTLTIGVPGFILSFPPNNRRYVPGFVPRVLRFTVPAGVLVAVTAFASYVIARADDLSLTEERTTATIGVLVVAFWVLGILARPFVAWKAAMVAGLAALGVLAMVVPPVADFYALEVPPAGVLVPALLVAAAAAAALEVLWRVRLRGVRAVADAAGTAAPR